MKLFYLAIVFVVSVFVTTLYVVFPVEFCYLLRRELTVAARVLLRVLGEGWEGGMYGTAAVGVRGEGDEVKVQCFT
jgi:hypothetical protein